MLIHLAVPILLVSIGFIHPTNAQRFNCSQPPILENFDINACCRLPEINLANATENCQKHVKSLKSYNAFYPPYAHVCYPECIYRETGSIVNDVIQMENVKRFLGTNISDKDKEIVTQIIRSFETCISSIEAHMKLTGVEKYAELKEGCSPYASMIYGCVNAETFTHCPASMWKHNDPNCSIGKSFVEQCNPLPHVPLPMV